jgi:hypothetical protein
MNQLPPQPQSSQGFKRFASGLPAIGWALVSQSIWLPLLVIDAHDRWQSGVRELKPEVASLEASAGSNAPPSASATAGPLLASSDRGRDPLLNLPVDRSLDVSAGSQPAPSHSIKPASTIPSSKVAAQAQNTPSRRPLVLVSLASSGQSGRREQSQPSISRSPVLAPSLRLADRGMPEPAQLAMAKRVSAVADDDPLASLPSPWREPMRRALQQLPATKEGRPSLNAARVIYVPSSRISAPATVPLAIQPDGSLDIFSRTADPVVIEELRSWSNRQPQADKGRIRPVVVHLTPLPSGTTAMVAAPSAAAEALRLPAPASRSGIHPSAQAPRPSAALPPPPPLPPLPSEKAVSPAPPAAAEAIATPAKLSLKRDATSRDWKSTSAPSPTPTASAVALPDPVPVPTPTSVANVNTQSAGPASTAPTASRFTTPDGAQ